MPISSHHQLHVRAANIDDEGLLHPTPELAASALLAEADRLAELLKNAFPFLSARRAGRPAFDDLEREKPEKCHAGEL